MTATLYDATRATLTEVMAGEPAYRVEQVWSGLYKQFQEVGQITTISATLREKLATALPTSLALVRESVSDKGDTVKF
ncbi:MAG: 23S rRNA (adenine(2503)-C(2))-methyltransferase RlmN, partial [Actinomycetota bacterium]